MTEKKSEEVTKRLGLGVYDILSVLVYLVAYHSHLSQTHDVRDNIGQSIRNTGALTAKKSPEFKLIT